MECAIFDRLSRSMIAGDVAAFAAGRELGRRWAEAEADFRDLRRLARNRDLLLEHNGDLPLIDALALSLTSPWESRCSVPTPFREAWEDARDDPELVAGFIAGAGEVFDEFIAETA